MDTFQNLVAWYNIIGRSLTMVVVLASVSKTSPDPGLALELESEKLKAMASGIYKAVKVYRMIIECLCSGTYGG
ncbi:MAG: hypothetical protein IPP42_01880 [Saprospiraceae bacterium]|nr:hypothetical protein [Saprospiraceae bacterium]